MNEQGGMKMKEKSGFDLECCNTEFDLYWKAALEMIEVIQENNKNGNPTVMIIPYGPIGIYPCLVYLINKWKINLRNCCFINMDEYLTDDKDFISEDNPLSFRGGMKRSFYDKILPELNVLPSNRIFPTPKKEREILNCIEYYGKLDMAIGGVGINGHFAFNEPPEPEESIDNEEFKNRTTRILKISRETRTVNAFMNCGGDIRNIPKYCITVGMKEIMLANKIRLCMPREWLAGILRRILNGEITAAIPCSLFREHKDPKIYASQEALKIPTNSIRAYNK